MALLQILETRGITNPTYVYICPPCGECYGPFLRGETIPDDCVNGCARPFPRLLAIPRSEASLEGRGLWEIITDEPNPRKVAECAHKDDAERFVRASNVYMSSLLALRKISRNGDDQSAYLADKVIEKVEKEN